MSQRSGIFKKRRARAVLSKKRIKCAVSAVTGLGIGVHIKRVNHMKGWFEGTVRRTAVGARGWRNGLWRGRICLLGAFWDDALKKLYCLGFVIVVIAGLWGGSLIG